jgi:hypothetical protein
VDFGSVSVTIRLPITMLIGLNCSLILGIFGAWQLKISGVVVNKTSFSTHSLANVSYLTVVKPNRNRTDFRVTDNTLSLRRDQNAERSISSQFGQWNHFTKAPLLFLLLVRFARCASNNFR